MKKYIYTFMLIAFLASCGGNKPKVQEKASEEAPSSSITTSDRKSAGAPASIEDLQQNFMGTFKGVLPCADCSGIETELTLSKDYTYIMKTTYLGKGDGKTFEQSGKWTPSEDLALIELDYDKKPKENIYFALIDRNTLEKLDIHAKPIESKANLRLTK